MNRFKQLMSSVTMAGMRVDLHRNSTGGSCVYTRRSMWTLHTELATTKPSWAALMKMISNGMDEKNYPSQTRRDIYQEHRE